MHTAIEREELNDRKFERWEALRGRVNTIGARAALDEALAKQEGVEQ